jgi:serine/threonine protein kinase
MMPAELYMTPLSASPAASSPPASPNIRVAGNISLTAEVEAVLRTMFSTFSQIAVEAEFGRGFSGSRAFRVRLVEAGGKAHLPAVVKIAPIGLIRKEWQAYQAWVEHTLPNIARLEIPPILPSDSLWGGLRYALVGSGTFKVRSLHDYYQQASADDVCWILENRLFRIMGENWWLDNRTDRAFQMQADYDILLPVNLLIRFDRSLLEADTHRVEPSDNLSISSVTGGDQVHLKGFVITKVDLKRRQLTLNVPSAPDEWPPASYRIRVEDVPDIASYRVDDVIDSINGVVIATRHDLLVDLARQALWQAVDLSAGHLTLSGGLSLPNPLLTYQDLLQNFLTVNISTIHGDLNLENILIDPATREVSLIDFATACQGHALRDLLRLETEVVIMLIPPTLAKAGLPPEIIYPFYEQLHQATLHYSGQMASPDLPSAALEKPFKMLWVIRNMARKCLFNSDDWREYYQGLTLYLLGALKFKSLQDLPAAPLPRQVAFWGAATAQHLLEASLSPAKQPPEPGSIASITPEIELLFEIEPPYGTMRPDSRFYIERAADNLCWQHIISPRAVTLFVQAPMQMGKSSLMRRVLYQADNVQHKPSAFVDFQRFTQQSFEDEESFFIQLCLMIGDALGVPEAIDQYWQGRRTNIVKCSRYLSEHIIPALKGPFILAMDEVERMLTCPFRANFFGMLRTWHNSRVYDENFARMTLFLSSSTDPYLLIDNPHQSPFNVATLVPLQDFTIEEVRELNRRHNSPLNRTQLKELMDLVNGHPFLTRLALYQLALGKIDMPTLQVQAAEDTGPFGDHLRHYLRRVLQRPELKRALIRIRHDHTWEETPIFYRLKEAGLIKKQGERVVLRNNLYDRYFKERLNG